MNPLDDGSTADPLFYCHEVSHLEVDSADRVKKSYLSKFGFIGANWSIFGVREKADCDL